jgi:hypothetical protein
MSKKRCLSFTVSFPSTACGCAASKSCCKWTLLSCSPEPSNRSTTDVRRVCGQQGGATMMSGTGHTSSRTKDVDNPYVRAAREGAVGRSSPNRGCMEGAANLGYPAARPRTRTGRQLKLLWWASQLASRIHTKWCENSNRGTAEFLTGATPMVENLVNHTQD